MKNKTGRFLSVLFWTAGIIWITAVFLALTGKIVPKIVLSGSMEPAIRTGSLVLIHQLVPPEKIKKQDIISYQMGENTQVMHRVVKIDRKERTFITKGDANAYADPAEVSFEQYKGKEIISIPYAGYAARFLQSGPAAGALLIPGIAAVLFPFIKKRKESIDVF